jgi:hypothetical protein
MNSKTNIKRLYPALKNYAALMFLSLLFGSAAFGQGTKRVCKTHKNHLQLLSDDPTYGSRRAELETPTPVQMGKKTAAQTVHTIPVVVHVIHNGETEGTGPNIPTSQIESGIAALTEDFRSTNSDTLLPTDAFYSLQSDVGLEFCLAQEDPDGIETTGIIRYNKGKSGWETPDFDANVKPGTIWDINQYLNIWITTFSGDDDQTLGYATFPGSTKTEEVGVVIGATYFGTEGDLTVGFDKNRTLTHEVGHFFNLFHIWGDATCGNDFVSDTPPQQQANDGACPTSPYNVGSICNPGPDGEMFMNYMDYTPDACMQLFSTGQKDRMRASLLLSDRIGLTTSNRCVGPNSTTLINGTNFILYPNPTANSVTVLSPNNFLLSSVAIQSLSGQKMNITYKLQEGNILINTSWLSNGQYILTIVGNTGTLYKKLVILK